RFLRQSRGASTVVLPGSQTPFILERANPPKGGDAKPWAFSDWAPSPPASSQRHRPLGEGQGVRGELMAARLPKGWTGDEPVRPQASAFPLPQGRSQVEHPMGRGENRRLSRSGDRSAVTGGLALLFCAPQFLSPPEALSTTPAITGPAASSGSPKDAP